MQKALNKWVHKRNRAHIGSVDCITILTDEGTLEDAAATPPDLATSCLANAFTLDQ